MSLSDLHSELCGFESRRRRQADEDNADVKYESMIPRFFRLAFSDGRSTYLSTEKRAGRSRHASGLAYRSSLVVDASLSRRRSRVRIPHRSRRSPEETLPSGMRGQLASECTRCGEASLQDLMST